MKTIIFVFKSLSNLKFFNIDFYNDFALDLFEDTILKESTNSESFEACSIFINLKIVIIFQSKLKIIK